MWELDHKESWALKNWCFSTVVLEKTLESPLNSQEIKSINPKGNQPRIFIGGTDAEAEAVILWPPDVKNWLIGKDPDDGKDWGQEEKGMKEDEMFGQHHRLNGHEFEQALGVGDGQGGWCAAIQGSQSQTRLSDWTELIEKETGRGRKAIPIMNFWREQTSHMIFCKANYKTVATQKFWRWYLWIIKTIKMHNRKKKRAVRCTVICHNFGRNLETIINKIPKE